MTTKTSAYPLHIQDHKVVIFGGRDYLNYENVRAVFLERFPEHSNVTIVSGMARGADALGVRLAKELGLTLLQYPAEWTKYGRGAGFRRNTLMAEIADEGLCFWDGQSRGTQHMIRELDRHNKDVFLTYYSRG